MRYYRLLLISLLLFIMSGCAELAKKSVVYPNVSLAGLQILNMGLFEQNYEIQLKIDNPNAFALPLTKLDYDLVLNGTEFANGVSKQAITVPANGSETVTMQVSSNFASLVDQARSFASGTSRQFDYGLTGNLFFSEWLPQMAYEYSGQVNLGLGSLQQSDDSR